jgi:hypothetical protein
MARSSTAAEQLTSWSVFIKKPGGEPYENITRLFSSREAAESAIRLSCGNDLTEKDGYFTDKNGNQVAWMIRNDWTIHSKPFKITFPNDNNGTTKAA